VFCILGTAERRPVSAGRGRHSYVSLGARRWRDVHRTRSVYCQW